ncbi:hypothetical protein CUC53_01170 [Aeromonas cavernicola]|uniref:Uncharacterized protein n=1 Tax=Aeromonas cavernicola TaxID=1006623 RepID=A0A2H9U9H4_9GAMM|nr:hypothetical protein CUC53_01170 [Aeromonas cavernicola]
MTTYHVITLSDRVVTKSRYTHLNNELMLVLALLIPAFTHCYTAILGSAFPVITACMSVKQGVGYWSVLLQEQLYAEIFLHFHLKL